jgi:hypothetical protein
MIAQQAHLSYINVPFKPSRAHISQITQNLTASNDCPVAVSDQRLLNLANSFANLVFVGRLYPECWAAINWTHFISVDQRFLGWLILHEKKSTDGGCTNSIALAASALLGFGYLLNIFHY